MSLTKLSISQLIIFFIVFHSPPPIFSSSICFILRTKDFTQLLHRSDEFRRNPHSHSSSFYLFLFLDSGKILSLILFLCLSPPRVLPRLACALCFVFEQAEAQGWRADAMSFYGLTADWDRMGALLERALAERLRVGADKRSLWKVGDLFVFVVKYLVVCHGV